jgi:DNA-directed RNA polymerase specialized sigma24 family protein
MADVELSTALLDETREAWRRYIDLIVPFRPELHQYYRQLTGDVWDAEALVQDALLKGFAMLGMRGSIANPRGYLARIATNHWIDTQRRRKAETVALGSLTEP